MQGSQIPTFAGQMLAPDTRTSEGLGDHLDGCSGGGGGCAAPGCGGVEGVGGGGYTGFEQVGRTREALMLGEVNCVENSAHPGADPLLCNPMTASLHYGTSAAGPLLINAVSSLRDCCDVSEGCEVSAAQPIPNARSYLASESAASQGLSSDAQVMRPQVVAPGVAGAPAAVDSSKLVQLSQELQHCSLPTTHCLLCATSCILFAVH